MEPKPGSSFNRVDSRAADWIERADDLKKAYGPDVVYSKQFHRARRDLYKKILKDFKGQKLTKEEKRSIRILRDSIKGLDKIILPRWLRVARNMARALIVLPLRLTFRILGAVAKILNRMLAVMTNSNGIQLPRLLRGRGPKTRQSNLGVAPPGPGPTSPAPQQKNDADAVHVNPTIMLPKKHRVNGPVRQRVPPPDRGLGL